MSEAIYPGDEPQTRSDFMHFIVFDKKLRGFLDEEVAKYKYYYERDQTEPQENYSPIVKPIESSYNEHPSQRETQLKQHHHSLPP